VGGPGGIGGWDMNGPLGMVSVGQDGLEQALRCEHARIVPGSYAGERLLVSDAVHGTSARWHAGYHCSLCRRAHSDTKRAWRQARAQQRRPLEVRQQLLEAIYAGQPFRTVAATWSWSPLFTSSACPTCDAVNRPFADPDHLNLQPVQPGWPERG
jgi:hypothetical protein